MINENLIVPIYNNQEGKDELVGTGFLIKEKGKTILLTSGHTFYKNIKNEYGKCIAVPNFKPDTEYFYTIIEEQKVILDFSYNQQFVQCGAIGNVYKDYAFFELKVKLQKGLTLENLTLNAKEESFKAIGYDPDTNQIKEYKRIVKQSYLDELYEGRIINLQVSKGESVKGNSGGPILNEDNKVIGMITRGQLPDEEKQQWFIKSDYLIKKLDQFIAKLEQQNKTND